MKIEWAEKRGKSRRRISAIVRKELDWVVHDKISMVILFVLPMVLILLVGNIQKGFTSDKTPVVYIIDLDDSVYSRAYIDAFRSENVSLEIHDNHSEPENVTIENAEALIPTPYLQAYMIIPENFSESLQTNRSATVLVYINGINMLELYTVKYQLLFGSLVYQIDYQVFNGEILYYPEQRPAKVMSLIETMAPNLLPNILFAVVNMVACQCIVADEPLKRMLLTPARKIEVIVAKTITYSFLGAILSLGCLSILWFVFDVHFISFLNAFLITFIATFFGVTLGVMFSVMSKSRIAAAQLFLFAYIMQMMIVNNLRIEPAVHYMPIEIVRRIFVDVAYRGIPLISMTDKVVLIVVLNLVILFITFILYRLRKEDV